MGNCGGKPADENLHSKPSGGQNMNAMGGDAFKAISANIHQMDKQMQGAVGKEERTSPPTHAALLSGCWNSCVTTARQVQLHRPPSPAADFASAPPSPGQPLAAACAAGGSAHAYAPLRAWYQYQRSHWRENATRHVAVSAAKARSQSERLRAARRDNGEISWLNLSTLLASSA